MSWRQFQFFDTIPIRDPNLGTEHPLYSDPSLTAIASTPKHIIISTQNSILSFIDENFKLVRSFKAYERTFNISFIRYIEGTDFFTTIAERQGQPALLKVWSIEKILTKKLDQISESSYLTQVHIKNGNNSFPITCFTYSPNFNILGVGFANGVVVVVRGDLLRDRGSSQTIAYKSSEPVTGLKLCGENNYDPLVYVATTSKILIVPTTSSYQPGNGRVLENSKGADVGNVEIDDEKLLVGRPEGIVFYENNGNSYTLSLEMPKKRIFKFGKYILVITSNSPPASNINLNGYSEPTKIIIADTEHKLISFSYTIASSVVDIFELWGDVYVLSSDGLLYKIHEKDIDLRIETVIKRDLYPIAIQIAENYVDSKVLLGIKRKYGDYLYSRNETTEAMDQYVATLQLGKTSEIIMKYKDSREVGNLARFLEGMLNEGLATKEHVTLLLCAYCKLKDVDRLDNFIKKYDEESNDLVRIDLDLDVVVEICRDSNLLEQASKLAQNFGNSSLAINILLRDLHDATQALNYIRTLPIHDTLRILVDYARLLLDSSPNVTTALLIDVFTGRYKPVAKDFGLGSIDKTKDETPVIIQSYKVFVNYMSNAASTITVGPGSTGSGSDSETLNGNGNVETNNKAPTYQPPRPRIIFPSFVNKPNEFVIFLEACAQSYDFFEGNEKDKNDILTTLFELYLTIGNESKDKETKKEWQKKAIQLSKSDQSNIDSNSILLISDMFDFNEGEILARNGPGFEIDLFRSFVASGDINGVFQTLRKYGDSEPELYPLALMFYTSSSEIFEQVGLERFKVVLDKIKKDRILSPLEIIQSLGVNKVATIDLIKDYIVEFVETEKKEIKINEKLVESYQKEYEKRQMQVHKLNDEPTIIQPTKCDTCSNRLDQETVHFLCHHSHHKYCLVEEDSCPLCAPSRETVNNIRESQRVIGERNDLFQNALSEADNRFKVITEFFGKGAMEKVNYKIKKGD